MVYHHKNSRLPIPQNQITNSRLKSKKRRIIFRPTWKKQPPIRAKQVVEGVRPTPRSRATTPRVTSRRITAHAGAAAVDSTPQLLLNDLCIPTLDRIFTEKTLARDRRKRRK
ncbi:unnamed protein product [Musa hybrid cultivar]